MIKVLVTGGTGFIGSNLVRALIRRDYSVRVFDNNFRGKPENLSPVPDLIELQEGDIRNFADVRKAVDGVDLIYHLAFINGTEFFYKHPGLVMDVGIRGHLNIMDACKNSGLKRFVYASSSEVYQTPPVIPTPEETAGTIPDVRNSRYSYGGSKLTGELLTMHYAAEASMERIIFRPHNIYGPSMGFEHVIPQLIKKIFNATDGFRKDSAEIEIQGSGEETRAFCYIDDAVSGIMLVGERGEDRGIYNVGRQGETKIKDLSKLIGEILNIKLTVRPGSLQRGSALKRCPDISKLSSLGYQSHTSLEEGLSKTVHWYKTFFLKKKEDI